MATPYVFVSAPEVTSTQDRAREQFDGTPVVWMAARQTAGRGRSGNEWLTADEALAISVASAPTWPPERWPLLALVAGMSVVSVLRSKGASGLGLKWPNDVMGPKGKVGGILAEASGDVATIGVGLNLYWAAPPAGMAGLWDTPPARGFREEVAHAIATDLLERLDRPADDWGRDEYRHLCRTMGTDVAWAGGGPGHVIDIADDGALVVRTASGEMSLRSGEVFEIRPAD